jgi:hypothetical protein
VSMFDRWKEANRFVLKRCTSQTMTAGSEKLRRGCPGRVSWAAETTLIGITCCGLAKTSLKTSFRRDCP